MNIWEFNCYKEFVRAWIENNPTGSRGKLKEMAEFLRVHSVVMSQTFNGTRDLTLEHAFELTKYLGLTGQKKRYFLLLVQYARAGTNGLKEELRQQLDQIRSDFQKLEKRLDLHEKINDEQSSIFYSSWMYSAIRLASELESINSANDLEKLLGVNIDQVLDKLSFLIDNGFVRESDDGLSTSSQRTHIPAWSPWVNNHHRNWRDRGNTARERRKSSDLFVTAPHTLSEKDFEKVRENILQFSEKQFALISKSKAETLACINIDLFRV